MNESMRSSMADLHDNNPEALVADGFEDAYMGYAAQACSSPLAVYDYDRCVRVLMERDGMSWDEAVDFIEFNVVGAFLGPGTPLFFYPLSDLGPAR